VDISKAKRVFELSKDNKKIFVTLWEGDKISSCITEEPPLTSNLEFPPSMPKQYCETCQCDDETCQDWIAHLKERGYQATEIELGELGLEESLPRFLEQREENTHADARAAEAIPGSPGELQPRESGGSSPETS